MAVVLVADDAPFVRTWCIHTLTPAGHQVLEATDGAQAVQLYEQLRPDAVLLDVTMPGLDGLAALAQIRAFDPEARVAMLTVMGQLETVVEAKRLGARDFLVKPCEASRLLAAVDKLLA
jgi:two-component system, chemotaxis family, chemotaxis protein CheY